MGQIRNEAIATGAVVLGFLWFFNRLPPVWRGSLPSETFTSEFSRLAGMKRAAQRIGGENSSLPGLFAYGAGCALVYGLLPKSLQNSPIRAGLSFGLLTWLAGHAGGARGGFEQPV